MHKREIEYEDFNGVKTKDVFYFNISKTELIELEVMYEQGFGAMLERIVEEKDNKELVRHFKEIVLMAYGQKSEDGKRFVKSEELRKEFEQTAAYDTLFMELATDDNAAVLFLQGVLPKDMVSQIDKAKLEVLPSPKTPPVPPVPPNS